jgi:signal transduction histidine kinase
LLLALEAGQMAVWEKGEASAAITWLDPKNLRLSMNFESEMARWIEALYPASEAAAPPESPLAAQHAEFRALGGDGRPRWVEARAQRLADANGEHRLVGILADVTERKRVGEALQEADRRKDEFLAVLAHELRNPLAPILTSAQLLRRRGLERPELIESASASIERQVKHLSRLIGDLSDISRIARGMIELKPEVLSLDAVVSQAVEVCRPVIDRQKQELFLDLPEEPVYSLADPARLAQVVGNLLINAAKFTPAGGNIYLTVSRAEGNPRLAVISVRDEGVGIDPAKLDAIFDSFVQLERPLHPGHSGLGIGLALARRLTRMQGGRCQRLQRRAGQGQRVHHSVAARLILVLTISDSVFETESAFVDGSASPPAAFLPRCGQINLHPAILQASRRRAVGRDRISLAQPCRADASRIDARLDQEGPRRLGPALGETEVVGFRPPTIGMAFDDHSPVGMPDQEPGQLIKPLPRPRLESRPAGLE